jgi:hypothetical protein
MIRGLELYTDRHSFVGHLHMVRGESGCHQWSRIYDISVIKRWSSSYDFYMRIFVKWPLHLM